MLENVLKQLPAVVICGLFFVNCCFEKATSDDSDSLKCIFYKKKMSR